MTKKQLNILLVIIGTIINAWIWTAIAVNCEKQSGYEFMAIATNILTSSGLVGLILHLIVKEGERW